MPGPSRQFRKSSLSHTPSNVREVFAVAWVIASVMDYGNSWQNTLKLSGGLEKEWNHMMKSSQRASLVYS